MADKAAIMRALRVIMMMKMNWRMPVARESITNGR